MNTSKIIRGVVSSGRYTVTAPIIKEDYGLYLQIEGVELPSTYQVDFSNDEHHGTSVTMIGNSDGVLIPSQFISSGKDVFAFLYHVGADFGRTVYKFRIPNKVRPDRTNEQPTPEEQSTIDQAISALNEAVAQTAQDVESADASAQSSKEDADRAEQARDDAQTAQGKAEDAQESAERAKDDAETSERNASESERKAKGYAETASAKADSITGLTAQAQTLPDGSSATANYNAETGVMSFGIPKGKDGTNGIDGDDGYSPTANVSKSGKTATITITDKNGTTSAQVSDGEDGATGATPNLTIGTVETLEPSESATASITGTPENPVLNLGIPQGEQGEVTLEDYYKAFPSDTASGAIASFSDGADDLPLKSLVVDINPIQDLSNGDPSPENICPISGWTEVGVEQRGKNLVSKTISGYQINASGVISVNPNYDVQVGAVKTGESYTITNGDSNIVIAFYASEPSIGSAAYDGIRIVQTSHTFTAPINGFVAFRTNSGYSTPQLELGSTATPYEPYTGRSITIDLGQTVYGGKLDVLSGELVVDRIVTQPTVVNGDQISQYGRCYIRSPQDVYLAKDVSKYAISDMLKPKPGGIKSNKDVFAVSQIGGANLYYFISLDVSYATMADYNAWLAENKPTIVLWLETPLTIQLTPNQVNSLLGVNNIWSDSGDCTAEYRANTKLWVQKKITEAVAAALNS